jgi:Cu2+-exporting ATPase
MSSTTYCFNLPGITCINCVSGVELALSNYTKHTIESYWVEEVSKKIFITVKDSDVLKQSVIADLQELMSDVGIESNLDVDSGIGVAESSCANTENDLDVSKPVGIADSQELTSEESDFDEESESEKASPSEKPDTLTSKLRRFVLSHWFLGALGLIVGLAVLILTMAVPGLPLAAMITLGVVSLVLTLILGAQSYYQAILKLVKTRTLTMDALFTISTLTVVAVSIAAFFVPWLPMMFEAGLLIFGFRHLGLAIEDSIKQNMDLDKKFQHMLPRKVRVLRDHVNEHGYKLVSLQTILVDDVLWIQAGDIIPVDGVCLSDEGFGYDDIKTGSTQGRFFRQGEHLISGMRLHEKSSPIQLKVRSTAANSYLARLDQNIMQANREKAPIQEVATRILQYFIPAVLGIAIISGVIIGLFFPPALAIQCAIAVLVSACPCTLGLVVPLAVKIGMHKGAENGVQFKSAKALQSADAIDVVVFDLNGTLTEGTPAVSGFHAIQEGMDESSLLAMAAAIEQQSPHATAKAICAYAQSQQVEPMFLGSDTVFDASNHSGLAATLDNHNWVIGNETMMCQRGVDLSPISDKLVLQPGETVSYLARDNALLGYFVLSDPLRKEARLTIRTLTRLGKQVHICTGADYNTARRYAEMLGIPEDNIAAGCVGMAESPGEQDKVSYLQSLKARGLRVAMVGDAGNDSNALAESNFGLAVKSLSGSDITQQQAGAVIQSGSLLPVANAFVIANQTVNNIKLNLGVSLSYNVATLLLAGGLLVAIGFTLNPGFGVALMVLQAVILLGIAYYLKKQPLSHLQEPLEDEAAPESETSYRFMSQSMKPGRSLTCDTSTSSSDHEAEFCSVYRDPSSLVIMDDLDDKTPVHMI